MVRVDLELMYCYVKIDFGHVFVRPSKAVMVLFEELDECKVEFGAEACSNLDLVVRVVRMDVEIIEFVYAWLILLQMLSWGRL